LRIEKAKHLCGAKQPRPFALLLLIEMLVITFKVQLAERLGFHCSRRRCRIHCDVGSTFPHHIDTRWGGHHSVDRAIGREF
jgi:hypothetical protein